MNIENKKLTAEYSSDKTPLKLGNIEIPCYVLSDGTRVLSRNGMQKALGYTGTSGDWLTSRLLGAKNISTNIDQDICAGLSETIEFARLGAGGSQSATYGYEATKLIDLCDALITLNRAGLLTEKQAVYAERAEIIIRSVAKVGIIALVDEATGYQNDVKRAKDELQQFLTKFLRDEASKWIKTFPDEFFEMIFKMKGWNWLSINNKKPGVVGHYINDWVYSRFAPAVLDELRKKNPTNPATGKRDKKHHQYLSTDYGNPMLKDRLMILIALGKASQYNENEFVKMVNRTFPKYGSTIILDFPDHENTSKINNKFQEEE